MGFSKELDGKTQDRGQKATGQCYKCRDESWFKRKSEFINILIEQGENAVAARIQDESDLAAQHLQTHIIIVRKKHAGHELGAREFSLTYSPKWMDDASARNQMIIAIGRLQKYYRNEIQSFIAVGETGKNGASHIHGYYLLAGGKRMTDKNFQRAWKYWNPKKTIGDGFEGGHHAIVKSESNFKGYIDKETNPWYKYNHQNAEGKEDSNEAQDDPSSS